jgi:MFS family permease
VVFPSLGRAVLWEVYFQFSLVGERLFPRRRTRQAIQSDLPLMPNLSRAVAVPLLRFSISQMDVPTRQSYTMAVVPAEERSAAGGFTGVARITGAAISPLFVGFMFGRASWINVPFFLAGALKILLRSFALQGTCKYSAR